MICDAMPYPFGDNQFELARVGTMVPETQAGFFTCTIDVEAFTATLRVVADWRDELQRKLDRAALRFELCGLDLQEQEELTEEVFAFTNLCRTMAHTLRKAQ